MNHSSILHTTSIKSGFGPKKIITQPPRCIARNQRFFPQCISVFHYRYTYRYDRLIGSKSIMAALWWPLNERSSSNLISYKKSCNLSKSVHIHSEILRSMRSDSCDLLTFELMISVSWRSVTMTRIGNLMVVVLLWFPILPHNFLTVGSLMILK